MTSVSTLDDTGSPGTVYYLSEANWHTTTVAAAYGGTVHSPPRSPSITDVALVVPFTGTFLLSYISHVRNLTAY